jgi:hypothetical protein
MRSMWWALSDRDYEEQGERPERTSARLQFDCDCNGLLLAIARGNDGVAAWYARYVMRKARDLGLWRDSQIGDLQATDQQRKRKAG